MGEAKHMLRFLIKLFVGFLIFGVLVWKIGPLEILKNLAQFKIAALLLINVTTLSGFFIGGTGVIILGKSLSPRLEWWQGMKGFLGSTSLALFVPGRVGDFALPFYWKRFLRYGECLALVLLDKMNTLFWVLIFGAFGLYVIFQGYMGFVAAALGFVFVFLLILLFSIATTRRVVSKLLPEKILVFLQGSMTAFRMIARNGRTHLFVIFILAGIRIFTYGVGFWVSLWGLDVPSPFFYSVFVMAVALFTSLIPISIMGLGPVEAVCVYGLVQINIDPSLVIAALVVGRAIALFWLFLFFFLFNVNKDFTKIRTNLDLLKVS